MAKTLGNTNCGHGEDAGVMCSVPPDQVRLVNGPNQCSGRVEVYHSGEWGTVCDDDWGMEDAEVVCREIGCGSAVSAPGSAAFGQGTGMIWLDDVVCTPAAASIFNCMAKPWGNTNSGHGEDTGVVCSASFQSFSPSGVSAQTTVLNSVKAGSDVTLPVTIGTQFRGREESVTDGSELISIVFTTDSGSYTISNPTSPGETQTAKTLLWVNGEADIVCTDTTMTLSVLKSSIEGQHENRLRLNDPSCSISLNGTHIIASVSLNSCGTQIKETQNSTIFENQITSFDHHHKMITRKHEFQIPFSCSFPKKSNISASFHTHKGAYIFSETAFGHFTYVFEFYTNHHYSSIIDPASYPVEVELQDMLYMEIQYRSDKLNKPTRQTNPINWSTSRS
nr:PREDICTED: deleted in malignant brain tumors 1 protein-like [Latimeria chalumnae]|eukprot:XP_014354167.1 PREDICTED: deleted in malignant brain tumors 1 protein-like [Latimeria chalumnae]